MITLCVLFWSINFVLGRFIKDDITPLELAFFRWFFVFLIISPILISRYKNIVRAFKQNFIILTVLAILGITTFNTLLYIGLTDTTSTNALIINSTVPILVLVLSYFILQQKINFHQTTGILLSTVGVVFLMLKADIANIFVLEFNRGDILIVISAVSWALYSVLVKFKPKDLNDFEYFATIVTIGLIFLLPFYLSEGYSVQKELEVLQNNYLVFLYVSVFASITSYYLWHYGIDQIGASKTAQFTHLMPVFGIILASIFLKETLENYHLLGAALIALGIYLSLFYKKGKEAKLFQ
ncbi:DMT family transporter [Sulfurimonas sp. C5]|uniref:DMT family transporter n=1 Tax=Sulfurimonas sp. C5 TaxID=3036947 RepID=UPI002458970A|nr:DMT family transporter [Sulfurimonas sp. C5]MDH4943819.1 DMT family transporter [Sulfurimonas sp. C5]